ncbi:hypothetical protein BH23CHL8_BH23CHL8_04820 [soil metagenome]
MARDTPTIGIDAHDPIAAVDIRPHRASRALQLVELGLGLAGVEDDDLSEGLERVRVTEGQPLRAVAHDEPSPVEAEPPALPVVAEGTQRLERGSLPDVGHAAAPCELDEALPDDCQALAEVVVGEGYHPNRLTRLRDHFAQRRSAQATRGFEETPARIQHEALGEGVRIMRAPRDHLPEQRDRGGLEIGRRADDRGSDEQRGRECGPDHGHVGSLA